MGASRGIKWTHAADQAVLAALASTATMAPVEPAKAVAAGTTQNPLLGAAARASSELSPALRVPRASSAAARITHRPRANSSVPTTWPSAVSRHAATSERVADVSEIWTRRMTGQTCWTRVPPREEAQPISPPTAKQTRLSTSKSVHVRAPPRCARREAIQCAMPTAQIHDALLAALADRHLLTHPFYRRWEAGTLGEGELAAYAEQYRAIERELPATLSAIVAQLPEGTARQLVEANLADELGQPAPHTELFESFAQAAGAAIEAPVSTATGALISAIRTAAATDPVAALAMVAAYEVQAADIAASKADGLRVHYGFDAEGTRFWDVHVTQEVAHAGWSVEALESLAADAEVVRTAAKVATDAWWSFLTERDELAPAAACV
jgi:pyrroloquinoline-quinone synthase